METPRTTKTHRSFAFLFAFISWATIGYSETISGNGEPMEFGIGYGILVNEGSSLERNWVIVNDERLPITLDQFTGLKTTLQDRNWVYEANFALDVSEPIVAVEVRFLPFDIWGEKERTLSATFINDRSDRTYLESASWRILSENEAIQHFGVVAYVAQVRLADGQILRANPDAVIAAGRRFSKTFSESQLELED